MEEKFTADDVAALRAKLGMTQQEFANAIGAGIRTIAGWESDKEASPKRMSRALRQNCIKLQRKVDRHG